MFFPTRSKIVFEEVVVVVVVVVFVVVVVTVLSDVQVERFCEVWTSKGANIKSLAVEGGVGGLLAEEELRRSWRRWRLRM